MIVRIVKMTFQPGKVEEFLSVFRSVKDRILAFEGCRDVQLLNELNSPNVFFTLSKWDSGEHLEKYRQSEFFKNTWEKTKILFQEKAEAWSLEEV